jgi:hypothetical protein
MLDPPRPEMRAAQLKEDLPALLELGEGTAAAIRARLDPEVLRRIESATRVDWLPLEVDLALVRAVGAEVGDDGLRRWGRAAARRNTNALFRPLVETAVRLFGFTPAGVFKFLPQAWKAAFRGCGELRVDPVAPGELRIVLASPPDAARDPAFLVSIAGAFETVYDTCDTPGRVQVERVEPGEVAFLATWTPRR